MAFDRGLEERLSDHFQGRHDLITKKMFGALCFLLSEYMCGVIISDKLMARVGPDNYLDCLAKPQVTEMDFTGKPVKRLVYILPDGGESDSDLAYWLNTSISFVDSLPPKQPKQPKNKKLNKDSKAHNN